MIRSLFIKLFLLAVTMGLVFWIGWKVPVMAPNPSVLMEVAEDSSVRTSAGSELDSGKSNESSIEQSGAQAHALNNIPAADEVKPCGLVDLNRAGSVELESLPGVGLALVEQIIAYRKSVGGFQSIEELRQVKGIGLKKFAILKTLVTVPGKTVKKAP